jgi:hypothetical protein
MDQKIKGLIGIAGNGFVGKDTFCNCLIDVFNDVYGLKSIRRSIAGDKIRNNLKYISENHFKINIENPSIDQKKIIRPFMVEYGIIMRNLTEGRYFIENFKESGYIDIIPDIRFCEYEKDEDYWLKEEKKGFLIFLEREDIYPANQYEEKNNKILKTKADLFLKIPTFKNDIKNQIFEYANIAVENYLEYNKKITTCQQDTFQPLNTF